MYSKLISLLLKLFELFGGQNIVHIAVQYRGHSTITLFYYVTYDESKILLKYEIFVAFYLRICNA